jgi:ketopantoate reductase
MKNETPIAATPADGPVRVLVLGAGVIGSVYAAEMTSLGDELRAAVRRAGRPAPALDALLSRR